MTRAIKATFLLVVIALMAAALFLLINGLIPAPIAAAIGLTAFAVMVLVGLM